MFEEFIGKTKEEIITFCEGRGIPVRVTNEDGKAYIVTSDFKPGRWNLTVKDNLVTSINLG